MLKDYLKEQAQFIDQELQSVVPALSAADAKLSEAMRYSLHAGGKRLRPILLMAAAEAVGGDGRAFAKVACGLEMIHTYSLIHDDLPVMDNDDYRRGKLTNHKVFGDAIALLAGDALLTEAFAVILSQPKADPAVLCQVAREIAQAAGPAGMVGGQVVDLLSENKQIDSETLKYMHRQKTGALFRAAVRSGALLAGASTEQLASLTDYAAHFGLAFQITDDILDVVGTTEKIGKPVGSDERNHKSTYVTLYTLEGARKMAQGCVIAADQALASFGSKAQNLSQLVQYLVARES
ncbi:MAG: polyprenyl synthetase family protein [Sporomusaceae bacterium]|nr:polyprenyl synthetase family protein [Sporomusaceae bacterium]